MEEFWILILVLFFVINSLDKAECVQLEELEETPLKIFDEIFGEGWWDNDKEEEWHKLTLEHNFHHQIDRQNTQLGQIEPNSTDQNPPLTESDHSGQIKPNSTDQNPPLTESDHSGQIEPNSTDQKPPLTESNNYRQIEPVPLTESDHSDNAKNDEDERKRKLIDKFHAMKDEFKQKGKFSAKEWTQIEKKIVTHLKVNRKKIYKWKKEFGLSRKTGPNFSDDEKLKIVKKLMQMKSERSGEDKKSCKEIDKEIAERFGVSVRKINRWKKKFGLSQRNSENERKNLVKKFDLRKAELMRDGFKNSYHNQINITVAKELGLSVRTIYKWKNELGQTTPKHKHSHNEQKELMERYYKIKDKTPKIRDEDIAKILKIGRVTLFRWKKQFKRQQLHPNFENFGPEGLFG